MPWFGKLPNGRNAFQSYAPYSLSAGVRMSQTAFCIMVVLSIIVFGEATAQNFLSDGAQARGGRVCYQRCTRYLKKPLAQCRAHCSARGYHRDNR